MDLKKEITNRDIKDNNLIKLFLENWAKENPFTNVIDHNAKFKIEFNQFLDSSNFSAEMKNLFKV